MKPKSTLPVIALAIVATAVSAHAANTALVNFGSRFPVTSGPEIYNNIWNGSPTNTPGIVGIRTNTDATSLSSRGLLDTDGNASGWTISISLVEATSNGSDGIVNAGSNGDYTGTVAPDAAAFFVTDATQAGILAQNGSTVRITISGLDNDSSYDLISFFGRNNTTSNNATVFSLTTGAATTARFQNAAGAYTTNTGQAMNPNGTNAGLSAQWLGVTPVGGVISFDFNTANIATNNLTDLKALAITVVPEPSAAGLGGLGALLLLRRRQRSGETGPESKSRSK